MEQGIYVVKHFACCVKVLQEHNIPDFAARMPFLSNMLGIYDGRDYKARAA